MDEMINLLLDRIVKLSGDLALAEKDRDHYDNLFHFKFDQYEKLEKQFNELKAEVDNCTSGEKGAHENA